VNEFLVVIELTAGLDDMTHIVSSSC